MLSLATFYNRAPDENISVVICSSLVSFSKGLPGAVPAQLPELRWAQGPGLRASDWLRDLGWALPLRWLC